MRSEMLRPRSAEDGPWSEPWNRTKRDTCRQLYDHRLNKRVKFDAWELTVGLDAKPEERTVNIALHPRRQTCRLRHSMACRGLVTR